MSVVADRFSRAMRPLGGGAICAAAVWLAACTTVGPDYRQPDDAVAAKPEAAAPFEGARSSRRSGDAPTAGPYSQAPLPAHWWRLYDDPLLDQLVAQALASNTDLRQAAANLERVEALETEVQGASQPAIAVNGGPSYGHVSGLSLLQPGAVPPNAFHYSAGAAVSYQVDLFGQLRRASEAAHASTESASAALDLVRVSVAAGTARAYADVCSLGLRLQSARKSAELQQEAVEASQRLQQAGRVSAIDVSRAKSQAQQLLAALPPLKAQREGAVYRLAVLTGTPPQAFSREVADCVAPPQLAGAVPVGDGAEMLRRRPDVRQAERELAATTARIGVAVADRYPKITLGLAASSAGTAAGFGRSDTFAWSLGPLISWTLPNTGIVDARIAQAEAGTRMAAAKFDGTVLAALRETETALSAYAHELDRHASLRASRDEASTVAEQARRMYRGGKVGYLDALDAERSLAASEAALAASDAELVTDQVTLFLALGGGW